MKGSFMPKNIILIGFMGVGKGRTARELARRTNRITLDTDDLIESMTKKKIRTIFAKDGEATFRALEQQTAKWLEESVQDTIVSTGGGFFMVKNIKKLGHVVYLHSSVEAIISAIENHPHGRRKIKKRPLLKDFEKAKELYKQRLPLYRQTADHEIIVEGKESAQIAEEIIELLKADKKDHL
jgi:shikimate kinase